MRADPEQEPNAAKQIKQWGLVSSVSSASEASGGFVFQKWIRSPAGAEHLDWRWHIGGSEVLGRHLSSKFLTEMFIKGQEMQDRSQRGNESKETFEE